MSYSDLQDGNINNEEQSGSVVSDSEYADQYQQLEYGRATQWYQSTLCLLL